MKSVIFFKALSDDTRLRIFNLLMKHELNVNEIVSSMNMGQSRISRHLKILSDSGLVKSRRDGLCVFYSAAADGRVKGFINLTAGLIAGDPEMKKELERLELILKERAKEKIRYFDRIAPDWDMIKGDIIGNADIAGAIVSNSKRAEVAVDLGCGTGGLMLEIRKRAKRVIGVDRSQKMLDEARRRLPQGDSFELRLGELDHLPMRDGEADLAVINMVLHYLPSPRDCIKEAARILKKRGHLVIADLDTHENEEMRLKYGHRWLGFGAEEMKRWLVSSGFGLLNTVRLDAKKQLMINIFFAIKE